jgi:hypothetical protein
MLFWMQYPDKNLRDVNLRDVVEFFHLFSPFMIKGDGFEILLSAYRL